MSRCIITVLVVLWMEKDLGSVQVEVTQVTHFKHSSNPVPQSLDRSSLQL